MGAFSHEPARKSTGSVGHYSVYRYTTAVLPKTIACDAYLIDTLMPDLVGHDGQPSAFLVYLYLWAQSRTVRSRSVSASYTQIAIGTGLSRSAVQSAVTTLRRRKLVLVDRGSPTAVPEYSVLRPWRR